MLTVIVALLLTVILGDTLIKGSKLREENDEAAEDPYALHPLRGMKSWWVALNTWSMDGLPGMMTYKDRATPEIVQKILDLCGLKIKPIQSPATRHSTVRELCILIVGLLIGSSLTMMLLQGRSDLSTFNVRIPSWSVAE